MTTSSPSPSPAAILFEQLRSDSLTDLIDFIRRTNKVNFVFPRYTAGLRAFPVLRHGCPILSVAAYFGSTDCFHFLVSNKADLAQADDHELTFVEFALMSGHDDLIDLVVVLNLQIPKFDFKTLTVVKTAQFNKLDSFHRFRALFELPIGSADQKGFQAIHYAVKNENIEFLNFCLAEGADINATTKEWQTPLHFAAACKNSAVLTAVLSRPEFSWDSEFDWPHLPLHIAAAAGLLDNVKILVKADPTFINKGDLARCRPLHLAIMNGRTDVMHYLVDLPDLDFDVRTALDYDYLSLAINYNQMDFIKLLLDKRKWVISRNGVSPFSRAVAVKNLHLAQTFYDCCPIDINATGRHETLLDQAIEWEDLEIIEWVLGLPGRQTKTARGRQLSQEVRQLIERVAPDVMEAIQVHDEAHRSRFCSQTQAPDVEEDEDEPAPGVTSPVPPRE
jgi:ankyrin repeat protein